MTAQVSVDVFARDRTASRTFDRVGDAATRNSKHVSRFGATVAGVFTGAALFRGAEKLVSFMGDSVAQASDLAEAQSKVNVVFGDSVGVVRKFAAGAADSAGLSRQMALEAQGTVGNLLLSMGKVPAEAATMSSQLVQLAADIGSFNNVDTADVLTAMRSGLTGEIAPLRRFGVNLTDATLKAKALELGLYSGKGALDISAKSSAAYALILEQTKTAQGDFARTSSGLANQQRILGSEVDNLEAKLGKKLMPVALGVTHWMTKEGVPAAEDLAHWLGKELGPTVRDLGDWIGENKDEWADMASEVGRNALPVLQGAERVLEGMVHFVGEIPGPIKKLGIEAAIASRGVIMLSSAMERAQNSRFVGTVRDAESRVAALRRTARVAGGASGLLLLAHGAKQSSRELGTLETVAGGALAGSVAGPWGALVGGALGFAMGQLSDRTDDAGSAAERAAGHWQTYADALSQTAGAMTQQTRATVYDTLAQSGALKAANDLGVSQATVLDAVLGQEDARRRLTAAVEAEKYSLEQLNAEAEHATVDPSVSKKQLDAMWAEIKARQDNLDLLKAEVSEGEKSRDATADKLAVIKKIPRRVSSAVMVEGLKESAHTAAELIDRFNITDKRKVRAIVEAYGAGASVKDVQKVIDKLDETSKTKADLTPFKQGVAQGLHEAEGIARSGGQRVGSAMKSGVESGFSGIIHSVATAAQQALQAALNATHGHAGINASEHGLGGRFAANFKDPAAARREFAHGFGGFQSSIFGTPFDETTPLTVDSILAFGDAEKNKAAQAKADMDALIKMGLSPSLIKQFQAQGPEGLAALHTLASSASPAQIALLNSQDKATAGYYAGLGMDSATAIWGATPPDVQGEITGAFFPGKGKGGGKHGGLSKKEMAEAVAEGMEGAHIQLRAKGGDLVGVLKTYKRDRGGGPIGLD